MDRKRPTPVKTRRKTLGAPARNAPREPNALQSYLQSPAAKVTPVSQLGLSIKSGSAVRRLRVETVAGFGPLMPLQKLKPSKLGLRARREIQEMLERAAVDWAGAARPRLDAEQENLRDRVAEAYFLKLLGQASNPATAAFQAFDAAEAFLQERDRRRSDGQAPPTDTQPEPSAAPEPK